MKINNLKPSPRCPECGSSNYRKTAFCCICDDCGEIFIPDDWLEDASEFIIKASKASIRRRTPKKKGDLLIKLSEVGSIVKKNGPMILKKAPSLFKLFI